LGLIEMGLKQQKRG